MADPRDQRNAPNQTQVQEIKQMEMKNMPIKKLRKKPKKLEIKMRGKGPAITMRLEESDNTGRMGISIYHEGYKPEANMRLYIWLNPSQVNRAIKWLKETP
jgi:hypothetical protein